MSKNGFTGIEIIVGVTVLGVLFGGTAVASDSSIPGDFLYPVDRLVENVQLAFTNNETTKIELKIRNLEERAKELTEIEDNHSQDASRVKSSVMEVDTALEDIANDVDEYVATHGTGSSESSEVLIDISPLLLQLEQFLSTHNATLLRLEVETDDSEVKALLQQLQNQNMEHIEIKTQTRSNDDSSDDMNDDVYEDINNDSEDDVSDDSDDGLDTSLDEDGDNNETEIKIRTENNGEETELKIKVNTQNGEVVEYERSSSKNETENEEISPTIQQESEDVEVEPTEKPEQDEVDEVEPTEVPEQHQDDESDS